MKYLCDVPEALDLAECFIELDDCWSRKEMRDYEDFFNSDKDEEYLALLIKKTKAFRLVAPGRTVTDLNELTVAFLRDEVDVRLANWFLLVPLKHTADIKELKKTLSLRLFVSTAANSEQVNTDPPN